MRQIKFLPLLSLFMLFVANAIGQATWNGIVNSDYNNPSNWTWTAGSGVPTSSTNIIVPHTAANPLVINGNMNVACNNLTITNLIDTIDDVMPYFIYVKDSATFTVHGDIMNGVEMTPDPNVGIINLELSPDLEPTTIYPKAKMLLGQTADHNVSGVFIYMGKVVMGNYNLTSSFGGFFITDSLIFNGIPVENGLSVGGNIILSHTSSANINAKKVRLPSFSSTQTPPHIITTNLTDDLSSGARVTNMNIGIVDSMLTFTIDSGLQVFPVGISTKSFNPISVNTSAANMLNIATYGPITSSCATTAFLDSSLKINYLISEFPFFGPEITSYSPVTLSYNVHPGLDIMGSNYVPPVLDGITVANVFNIIDIFSSCYSLTDTTPIVNDGNYRTVSFTPTTGEQVLLLSSATTNAVIELDSFIIYAVDGTVLTDPLMSYGFSAEYFPSTISSDLTWEIIPISGAATVSPMGTFATVTGTANGTVWLKGTPVDYPGFSDSILLTINLPPAVASITVSTLSGAPAAISVPSGTLPLVATVMPTGASSAVTWSLSSGAGLATISSTGVVTAIANGTVVARATSVSTPTVYGEITITISNQIISPTSIVVSTVGSVPAAISIPSGTLPLNATVMPTGASSDVSWSITSGSTLANISSTGVVTALANGTVTARATSISTPSVYGELMINITNQPTSINNAQYQDALSVYPNPATDNINISFSQSHPALIVNVYDVQGKTVYTQSVKANELNNTVTIPTKRFAPGAYFISLEGDDFKLRSQIVKK